ncbi:cupin domain-containing protein [Leptospira sanjuanensis]|uniref:cupin domain-containing protein n=1 Tax=Leptospira sanjuanensis TaxID=2879643 RepID=UPI001EE91CB0|nr:cupin domain-containing protein [Leptospira sanjuanensis]MCG6168626.1 cupin domain-containing protein [Leptospira sanjuanensis]
MTSHSNPEPRERWEDFVFPNEVFDPFPANAELEEIFHLQALSSLNEILPESSVRDTIISSFLVDGTPAEDFLFVRDGEISLWKKSPFEGVEYKILNHDTKRQTVTLMIRMEPNAVFPAHSHSSAEDCLLIKGDLNIAGATMQAGDFHRANAGSKHKKFTTASGAEFLIVTGESDFSASGKFFS